MRFALIIALLAGCYYNARPSDQLGPGIMCQPLTEYKQRCWDHQQHPWVCDVHGPGWECQPEYPMNYGYTTR